MAAVHPFMTARLSCLRKPQSAEGSYFNYLWLHGGEESRGSALRNSCQVWALAGPQDETTEQDLVAMGRGELRTARCFASRSPD